MKFAENILKQMPDISKPRKKFMVILFKTVLAVSGRVNFLNLSRYSDLNEKTYSRNFRRPFDFLRFNSLVIEQVYHLHHQYILALDASYIFKSGKATYGLGKFWNGVQGRSTKGLEISSIALVDVTDRVAYTLTVSQVPPAKENAEENSIDFALRQLKTLKQSRNSGMSVPLPPYLAVDGFYAKNRFVNGAGELGFITISKLRQDANLKYLHPAPEPEQKRRGRPRKYAGKVNLKAPDFSRLCFVKQVDERTAMYSGIVYSLSLSRAIKIVYLLHTAKNGKQFYAVLFSTDLEMDAQEIYLFYTSRFQIEFIFRDAKQYNGLTHCQARDKEALNFHFNMSLALLNLMRLEHQLQHPDHQESFSMASYKRQYANEMMLNLFLSKLEIDPNLQKIQTVYQELRNYGSIAA